MEDVNPARRYKWFRPRQAARASFASPSATNYATISLFNNSKGSQYLVVRDVGISPNSSSGGVLFSVQGALGAEQPGWVTPIIPVSVNIPGTIYYIDAATVFTTIEIGGLSGNPVGWIHDFPFWVLPPGWALAAQATTQGQPLQPYFGFEAIEADELDFLYQGF